MTVATRFAEWALEARPPDEVATVFKRHILDALGCAIGAWRKDLGTEAARITQPSVGKGIATILGRPEGFSAEDAAFANGALVHALDFDDTHSPSVTHATAVVVPAALAVAEAEGKSGEQALSAAILGVEIVCRLGAAARNRFHLRGFHPTSVCGVFGAALAAGLLLGADRQRLVHALGLAGSFASGLMAYLEGSANPKPLHVAHAARDGVAAARLAMAGATGPATVIEGRFGLYDAFVGSREVTIDDQLGTRWESTRLSIKPYPACHSMHACLDAAARLQSEHGFAAADITGIEAVVAGERDVALVLEPIEQKRRPASPTVARFSLPFSLGHLLVKGSIDIDTADPGNLGDPEVLALADRVTYRIEPFATAAAALPGAVRIRLASGAVLEQVVPVERGSPDNPLPESDILAKFRANAGLALSAADRDDLMALVLNLEACERLDPLAAILRRLGGRPT